MVKPGHQVRFGSPARPCLVGEGRFARARVPVPHKSFAPSLRFKKIDASTASPEAASRQCFSETGLDLEKPSLVGCYCKASGLKSKERRSRTLPFAHLPENMDGQAIVKERKVEGATQPANGASGLRTFREKRRKLASFGNGDRLPGVLIQMLALGDDEGLSGQLEFVANVPVDFPPRRDPHANQNRNAESGHRKSDDERKLPADADVVEVADQVPETRFEPA